MILQSLAGLPAFLVYFCTGVVAVMAYLLVYTWVTPHNEFKLIRENDPAAAVALASPGDDEVVLERSGTSGEARLLVEVGADASAALGVEEGHVADDERVVRSARHRDGTAHTTKSQPRRGRSCYLLVNADGSGSAGSESSGQAANRVRR